MRAWRACGKEEKKTASKIGYTVTINYPFTGGLKTKREYPKHFCVDLLKICRQLERTVCI